MILSKQQQEIVDYKGYLIVEAPPGSGKTFTLVSKIEKVQKESQKKIIALTFSNKAAEELKHEIVNQENVVVGTIHAFCQDIVMSRGYQIGLPEELNIISDDVDKLFVIREVIENNHLIKRHINDMSDEHLKKILAFIKKQKQNFIEPKKILETEGMYKELYYEIYSGYNNKMITQKLLDFDDLIYYAYLILSREETRQLYKRLYGHLYIDEAQDLNFSQYQIIKLLASMIDDVMLIGDPSQAIYRFMGSDKRIMKEIFKHDFNAKTIQLNENYRSARKIVKLINLFKNENESLSKYPIEGVVKYTQYDNEEEEAKDIINKIKILVSENGIKYDEIAILGRNSYLFNSIIEQLKKENIPFNIGAQSNLEMETKTGKLLLEYIKLLANPYNERIRNEFQQLLELDNNEVSLIKQFMEKDYPDVFNIVEKSIKSELVFKMELENYIKKITKTTNMIDEEKFLLINDMKTLIENWNNYLKRSKSQNKNLKIFLNDFTMGKTMTFNFEGVSLLTIHKSKGLEYDTTFVVGLNEGTLPDYRSLQGDDLVEEDNNVYVALSRAKRRCFISSVKNKIMPWGKNKIQKESRYVEIIKKIEE